MKRVILLGAAAVVVLGAGWFYIASRGGMYSALDMRCDFEWTIDADRNVGRVVELHGPSAINQFIASTLQLDATHGWKVGAKNAGLELRRLCKPADDSSMLAHVDECTVTGDRLVFRERLVPRLTQRLSEPPSDPAATDAKMALWADFNETVTTACKRFGVARDAFLGGIPATLTIHLPGEIETAEGFARTGDAKSVRFSGTLGELANRNVHVVSRVEATSYRSMWIWIATILAAIVVTVAAIRARYMRRLREEYEARRGPTAIQRDDALST